MALSEKDLESIEKLFQQAHDTQHCSSEICKERCGITPVQHADDHAFIGEFKKAFQTIKNRFLNMLTAFLVVTLLSLVGWGGLAFLTTKLK